MRAQSFESPSLHRARCGLIPVSDSSLLRSAFARTNHQQSVLRARGAGVLNDGSSLETFNGSVRERSYFMSAALYTSLPPTIVNTDTVFGNSGVGTVNMSCDSTAISASLPGSIVPFSFS
jgi:hypothetical protein